MLHVLGNRLAPLCRLIKIYDTPGVDSIMARANSPLGLRRRCRWGWRIRGGRGWDRDRRRCWAQEVVELDITMQNACRAQVVKDVHNFRSMKIQMRLVQTKLWTTYSESFNNWSGLGPKGKWSPSSSIMRIPIIRWIILRRHYSLELTTLAIISVKRTVVSPNWQLYCLHS